MIKRNFPLILMFLMFVGLLYVLFSIPRSVPEPEVPFVPEPKEETTGFSGRVVMPGVDDIYVLENSADRDIEQLVRFLQGRAAGLHYLAAEHFRNLKKNARRSHKKVALSDDILVGVRMTLDSLGHFTLDEYVFSNTEDESFKKTLADHIGYYWRYPKSASGKLEFWIPIRWMAEY